MYTMSYVTWFTFISTLCVIASKANGKDFKQGLVKLHNTLRNIHNSPALKLDAQLTKQAQTLADEAAANGKFGDERKSGTNTFMLCTTYARAVTPKETVEAWYDEVCAAGFSFEHPRNPHTLAFTQLIWKDASIIGIGKSVKEFNNDTKCSFVVALYRPPGNIVNQGGNKDELFLENIQKGKFQQSYCDKFNDKRQHVPSKSKRSIKPTTYETQQNIDNHLLDKRSLYYRFPAKFLIDPLTGQAKAVEPERNNENSYVKSQLGVAPPYDRSMYNNMPYMAQSPYTESSLYNQEVIPQSALAYSGMNHYNYENVKPADTYTSYDSIGHGMAAASPPTPIVVAAYGKPKVPRIFTNVKKQKEEAKPDKKHIQTAAVRTTDDKSRQKLKEDALAVHNAFREIHGSPALQIDDKLSAECQVWAEDNAEKGRMEHSVAKGYGENLAYRCTGDKTVSSVNDSVADWYREVCTHQYDFTKNSPQYNALHFTQLVWKKSTKLGIGMATSMKDDMLCTYFVARYTPRGNMGEEYKANVLKGSFDFKTTCEEIDTLKDKASPSKNQAPGSEEQSSNNTSPPEEEVSTTPSPPEKPETSDNNKTPINATTSGSEDIEKDTAKVGVNANASQQDQDEKNYEDDAVKVMNAFRKIHNSPPLEADSSLRAKAKARADSFVTGIVKRSERKQQAGENVQVACNPLDKVLPPEEAIGNWYREVCGKNYTFEIEGPQNASHFTQMIWKTSTNVGVAYATKKKKSGNLCTVVVAEYEPVGNVATEFMENIQKGSYDRSFCGSINTIASAALDDKTESSSSESKLSEPNAGENPEGNKPEDKLDESKPAGEKVDDKPEENFGDKKPEENNGDKKPEDNLSNKKPEDIIGPQSPAEKLGKETPKDVKWPEDIQSKPESKLDNAKTKPESKLDDAQTKPESKLDNAQTKPESKLNDTQSQPDSKLDDNKPAENLGDKKPEENNGDKKPEDDLSEKKPEDILGEKNPEDGLEKEKPTNLKKPESKLDDAQIKPESKLDDNKPAENLGDKKPEENNGDKKPEGDLGEKAPEDILGEKKPEDSLEKEKQKDVEKPESKLDDTQIKPESKLDDVQNKPESKLDDNKPAENLGDKKPEENNGDKKPEDDLGEKAPEDILGEKKPEDNLENEKPEDVKKPESKLDDAQNKPESKLDDAHNKPESKLDDAQNKPESKLDDTQNKPESKLDDPQNKPESKLDDNKPAENLGDKKPEENNGDKKPEDDLSEKKPEDILGEKKPEEDLQPEDIEFAKDGLKAHNALRNIHQSQPMVANVDLTKKAKQLAISFSKAGEGSDDDSFAKKRAADVNLGENIEKSCHKEKKKLEAEDSVLEWWSKGFCDPGAEAISQKLLSPGSQVVWNSSVEFGMAHANFKENDKFCVVIVALYTPKGNIEGEFVENVKEGDFDYNTMCDDKNSTLQIAKELLDKGPETEDEGITTGKPVGQSTGETDQPAGGTTSDATEENENSTTKPGETSEKPTPGEATDFEQQALKAHNILRKIHNADEITRSEQMSQSAAAYAEKIANSGIMEHSSKGERNGDGENLAMECSSEDVTPNGATPVKNWYNEVCKPGYDFQSGGFSGGTGHFTQAVWKGTNELGIGYAKGKKDGMTCLYTVARYRPAGNMQGNFATNVLKGKFDKEATCLSLPQLLGLSAKKSQTPGLKRSSTFERSGVPLRTMKTTKGVLRTFIQPKRKSAKKRHLIKSKN